MKPITHILVSCLAGGTIGGSVAVISTQRSPSISWDSPEDQAAAVVTPPLQHRPITTLPPATRDRDEYRPGSVRYSLVQTFRNAWRRDDMRHQPRSIQIQTIALMQAIVETDVPDAADREATLDYIEQTIDSW